MISGGLKGLGLSTEWPYVHGLVAKRPSFSAQGRGQNSLSAYMMFELPLMDEQEFA